VKDEVGRVEFLCDEAFWIEDMSYRMKQALGFYYATFPQYPIYDYQRSLFTLRSKAIGYNMLSP
jgi:hypothetical protein